MVLKNTKATRVLLGRLDRGEEVVSALVEIARAERVDAASIRAQGVLEDAELAAWDPGRRAVAAAWSGRGPGLELVALAGTVALRDGRPDLVVRAAVAAGGERRETAAGLLVRAHALAVEFVFDVYDDAVVPRREDPDTGIAAWDP